MNALSLSFRDSRITRSSFQKEGGDRMASKILVIYLRFFIFIEMMSSISSKNLNYQQMLNNPYLHTNKTLALILQIPMVA